MSPALFVSYRRSQEKAVDAVCALLKSHGLTVWLDRTDIEKLEVFPDRIRQGLAGSHAVLVWWSRDYSASRTCLEELRLAWQMARQHLASEGERIWIVNPEFPSVDHIYAGDRNAQDFLAPPPLEPDRENAWAEDRLSAMAALAKFGPLSDDAGLATVPPPWYGRPAGGTAFVGRGAELWRLHSAMFPPLLDRAADPSLVQLHGTAGVGKSALAAHYAETFAGAYPGGIWWFNMAAHPGVAIESADEIGLAWLLALEQSIGKLSPGWLAEISRGGDGCTLAPAMVRERLARLLSAGSEPKPYLWVLDKLPSVEQEDLREEIVSFLRAPSAAGRTLITCRDALPLAGAKGIAVLPLPPADGETLLGRYLAPEQQLRERKVIAELVTELGGHPLALMLIGKRVATSPWGLTPVLEQVRQHGALLIIEQIHSEVKRRLGRLAPSVLAAFQVSLEPLDDAARQLLAAASVCAPNKPIPVKLLKQAFSSYDEAGGQVEPWGLLGRFDSALGLLWRASLIGLDENDRQTVTVQPLVAAVMLHALGHGSDSERKARKAVAEALLSRLSGLDSDSRAFIDLRTDMPHAQAILDSQDSGSVLAVGGREVVLLALGLSRLHDASGHPAHALKAAYKAVVLAAQHLDADDPDYLRAQTAQSSAMAAEGFLNGAAELQEWLLPRAQRVFGETHEDALLVRSLLATTRFQQHRLDEAEQLQVALLDTVRNLPDIRRAVVMAALSGLAATLHAQYRYDQARCLQEEALALSDEAANGPHPDGVVAMHNLAATHIAQRNVDAAIALQTRALKQAQLLFGIDHPTTRLARCTLADAFVERQDYDSAIPLYQQAYNDATKALGADHPESLVTLSRLFGATAARGKQEDADELQQEFLAAAIPVLPAGHPDALAAVEGLARALNDLGRPIGHLAPLLEHVLQARLRDLGEGHLETVHGFSNLALARSQAGLAASTVDLRREAIKAARALKGDATIRNREMAHAHMQLVLLLDGLGQSTAARQAEAEAVVDLRAFRRSLQLH